MHVSIGLYVMKCTPLHYTKRGLRLRARSSQKRRRSNATASCPSSTSSSAFIASRPFSSAWRPCSAWLPPSRSPAGGPATSCCWRRCLDTACHSIPRTSAKVNRLTRRRQLVKARHRGLVLYFSKLQALFHSGQFSRWDL